MTDQTPAGPPPNDPFSADAVSPGGLKGWLQRRAESLLSKPGRALPALTEPGDAQVVLQVTGATPIKVVKVICQATGLDIMSAGNLVRDAPVVVASGISEASAEAVVARLELAGARAVVGETYKPQ
jgi:ribosomal protein L7/L12